MTKAFEAAQWAKIRDDYSRFWRVELDCHVWCANSSDPEEAQRDLAAVIEAS